MGDRTGGRKIACGGTVCRRLAPVVAFCGGELDALPFEAAAIEGLPWPFPTLAAEAEEFEARIAAVRPLDILSR
jgi:hypothetical protein